MSVGKGLRLPTILSANALLSGAVVYFAAPGWSERLGEAEIARDEAGLARLEAVLAEALASEAVVGPELVAVALDGNGRIVPGHYRARIRALGPTVRPDLGPQARGEHLHVSL